MATTAVSGALSGFDTTSSERRGTFGAGAHSLGDTVFGPIDAPWAPLAGVRVETSHTLLFPGSGKSETATRVLNVAVAAIALVLTLPVFVLIALLVKLTSPGPVFYKQTRVGRDRRWRHRHVQHDGRKEDLGGKPFTIFKFRTMVQSAEADGTAVWATRGDARVTALGRFLRASRLDELPQLVNVLMGDMNVVGPRPERPEIFVHLRETIPYYHLRQRALPGITGWAQINQPYDECIDDVRRKVAYDLEYLSRRSVVTDFIIMVRTLPVMVLRSSGW